MEGRRSRSKPSEVETKRPGKVKGGAAHVAPAQAKAGAKVAVTRVDDRCVPTVGGENKRKRAPRGPAGRNLKARVEVVNGDDANFDANVDSNVDVNVDANVDGNVDGNVDCSPPAVEEEVLSFESGQLREAQRVVRKEEEKSGKEEEKSGKEEEKSGKEEEKSGKEEEKSGTENGELQEGGLYSKDQVEKRRGSSRLRVRPSKFRESVIGNSSSKVKGEAKSGEDDLKPVDVVALAGPPPDNGESVPAQVDTRDVIAKIFSRRKENKSKSAAAKGTGSSSTAPVVSQGLESAGLKAVLLALKRVMKMKEADPFNKPVDPVKLGIPDYLEVVTRPMDLGTIHDRLENGEVYSTVEDVFEDVALVWSNCRKYNDDGDPIMGLLQNLESSFNKFCLAAGFPFHATNASNEAGSEKPKGEDLQQQKDDQVKVPKKKKAKVAQPDAGALLKSKIKRSAPVDQVMAESKAREQQDHGEEPNVRDLERRVKNAVENSSGAEKQVETPQTEQESEHKELHDDDQEPLQGPVETPSVLLKEEESAPTRHLRKATISQHVSMPVKIKRPNGHSTLTHRQGCLCVVCVGRRKREAKLRKSGGAHAKSKLAKKKSGGPNSGDMAAGAEEDVTFTDDGEDALNGHSPSDNVHQGYTLKSYQLPLRKLDPYVVEMSRIFLGSKPGSILNRPRSLGYVAVPFSGRRVGIADAAISFLSK